MGTTRTTAVILCVLMTVGYTVGSIGWSGVNWSLVHTNGEWAGISAALFWLSVLVVSACLWKVDAEGNLSMVIVPPLIAAIASAIVFGIAFLACFVGYLGTLN